MTHTIFNAEVSYSCTRFVVEIYEKSSLQRVLIRFNDDWLR